MRILQPIDIEEQKKIIINRYETCFNKLMNKFDENMKCRTLNLMKSVS